MGKKAASEAWRVFEVNDETEDAVESGEPEIQFDPKFHGNVSGDGSRSSPSDELRKQFGTTDGFQTTKVRRPRKNTPKWAKNDSTLVAKILGKPALRRLRILRELHLAASSRRIVFNGTGKGRYASIAEVLSSEKNR